MHLFRRIFANAAEDAGPPQGTSTIDPVLLGDTLIKGLIMGLDRQFREHKESPYNTEITLKYIFHLSRDRVLQGRSTSGSKEFQDIIKQLIYCFTREGLERAVRLLDANGSS
ncbi:uncharacterized protein BKCO1_1100055 [Diplodia corticola]|uniref:Uncharacterized protein n=1 Tax=Diplodia corticola TaxID=236234 RepID=A0A1J9RVC4_9PEZI|nr:uncharacterized protein BKCO1_1100055 [Diplodia corticola]OJD36555.1 hypothetical protein BKCO1_1100055 [Diplodia corticola]